MSNWFGEIVIGTLSAVLGAALTYFFAYGVRLTKASRMAAATAKHTEVQRWRSGDPASRQRISGAYLFEIMKRFMVGNMFWVGASLVGDLSGRSEPRWADFVMSSLDVIGFVFFVATLAKILRFSKLLRLDEEADAPSPTATPPQQTRAG